MLIAALTPSLFAHARQVENDSGLLLERPADLDASASFREDRSHVSVINLAGDYHRLFVDGALNAGPRVAVAQEFLRTHADAYDFVVIFSSFDFDMGDTRAFALSMQNDVLGIGVPLFDDSQEFGSDGKLQSYIDMGPLRGYVTDPQQRGFDETISVILHELLHRWGVQAKVHIPGDSQSSILLGRDGNHWSFLLDSGASVIYGNDWRDEGNGTFRSISKLRFYSPLDLYLMGFYAPEEVPPFFVIQSPGTDANRLPEVGAVVSGTPLQLTIEDIIAANGPRVPAAADSQHDFRAAFIYLVRPGEPVTDAQVQQLDNIREALITRFTILTGGRGRMEVFPEPASDAGPGSPDPLEPGPTRPDASLADALAWLRAVQRPEGFWEDKPGTRVRDTAVVGVALEALDPFFDGDARGRALAWMQAQPAQATVDYLARGLSLQGALNGPVSPLFRDLLGLQNADGGWGLARGFRSDALDTAVATLALEEIKPRLLGADASSLDAPIARAADFLLAQQNADGGWPQHAGGASRAPVTASVLRALRGSGRSGAFTAAAAAFLAARQNADGGFGDSPSTAHDTAHALLALAAIDATGEIDIDAAASYLRSHQTVDGSWEASAYATALVVRTLKQLTFPNLTFEGAAIASPQQPVAGQRVDVQWRVVNNGSNAAPASLLRLFDGAPEAGGAQVAEIAVPALASHQAADLRGSWEATEGTHSLVAVLDPDGALDELSERDNRAELALTVAPAPAGPDLAVSTSEVQVTPLHPDTLPAEVAFSAVVRNLGSAAVADTRVVLWKNVRGEGTPVAEAHLTIPPRSSAVANFVATVTSPGATLFFVEIDPDGAVAEASETNNVAEVVVTTASAADLEVRPQDLSLTGAALVGHDASFTVELRNRGTTDSPEFTLLVEIGDGSTFTELVRARVALGSGEEVTRTAVWRVTGEGQFQLRAVLDPENLIPEPQEANNAATLTFTAGQLGDANLTVDSRDLQFQPSPALEGQTATVSALVRNTGGQPLSDVTVAFYDGDPSRGVTIGPLQSIASLAVGESARLAATLPLLQGDRDRLLFVVVDPSGAISEHSETDNGAFETLRVLSLPDLALSPSAVTVSPLFPSAGDIVTLLASVANLGEQGTAPVVARLVDAATGASLAPDVTLPAIAGGGLTTAVFSWSLAAAQVGRTVAVVVDPEARQVELSRANNRVEIVLPVAVGGEAVVPRYFSPNGDGVQDSTSYFFQLDATADVSIAVVGAAGRVVRHFSAPELRGIREGRFVWDGRDDEGRIVTDGDYQLLVLDGAGTRLRQALVTLDNDRASVVEGLGTPLQRTTNLTCDVDDAVIDAQLDPLGGWFYYTVPFQSPTTGFMEGRLSRAHLDGSGEQLLASSPAIGLFQVSADGSVLAGRMGSTSAWLSHADGTGLRILTERCDYACLLRDDRHDYLVNRDYFANGFQRTDLVSYPWEGAGSTPLVVAPPQRIGLFPSGLAPDGNTAVFGPGFAPCWDSLTFLTSANLSTGSRTQFQSSNFQCFQGDGHSSWSADSQVRLTISHGFDLLRGGQTLAVAKPPFSSIDAYRSYPFATTGAVQITGYGPPAWSSLRNEALVEVTYNEPVSSGGNVTFGQILRLRFDTNEMETVAWLEPSLATSSYRVSTWDGSSWVERGVIHSGPRYGEESLELGPYLPDPAGEYKVRIRQVGGDAAQLDRVLVRRGAQALGPARATLLGGGDVTTDAAEFDSRVVDVHGRELEVAWDRAPLDATGAPPGAERWQTLVLGLVAREETELDRRGAVPFSYPADDDSSFAYRIESGGGLRLDGAQTGHDRLGDPLFVTATYPQTGHPVGEVVGYLTSDGQQLLAALDFTVDNTVDGERDWASLWVEGAGGWRELRVTAANPAHGRVGFVTTGGAAYPHKYYEFAVPLAELGLAVGDTVSVRFAAYGTAAAIEGGVLPPRGGRLQWLPGENSALYLTPVYQGASSWVIRLDQDVMRPVLPELAGFEDWRLGAVGTQLLLQHRRDANDPQSACYGNGSGNPDWFLVQSLANLTAELRVRNLEQGGFALEGTAADLHFHRYLLEYAHADVPTFWTPIRPPSTAQVVDGELGTWIAPGAGDFLVRLTVEDLAGNRRQAVRRLAAGSSAALTDLYVDPHAISPNGDGVRDAATIHYRVLHPTHVELQIVDARGDRVRTFRRDHANVGEVVTLVWDGRNDGGLVVPDGRYTLEIQGYRFTIYVDTRPPTIGFELPPIAKPDPTPPESGFIAGVRYFVSPGPPRITVGAEDGDVDVHTGPIEAGIGSAPLRWEAIHGGTFGETTIEVALDDYVGRRFRTEVTDEAGNRALSLSGLAREELILWQLGRHGLDAAGALLPLDRVPWSSPTFAMDTGDVRFRLTETVFRPLGYVEVQYRSDLGGPWQSSPIVQLLRPGLSAPQGEVPDRDFEAVWDMQGVPLGSSVQVRLRAVDADGGEHLSNEIRLSSGGLLYHGRLLRAEPGTADLLASSGIDPQLVDVLWGEQHTVEPVASVALLLRSPDDPRYSSPVRLQPAASGGGVVLFLPGDLAACREYRGYLEVTTEPYTSGGVPIPSKVLRSVERSFVMPCLELRAKAVPRTSETCGAPPPGVAEVVMTPRSADGTQLRLLTVSRRLPDGSDDVLFNVNQPVHDREYRYEIDYSQHAEGPLELRARLTNVADDEDVIPLRVVVDRTAPQVALTYPLAGQRVCQSVAVEGAMSDGAGFAYLLEYTDPTSGQKKRIAGDLQRTPEGVLLPPFSGTFGHHDVAGALGSITPNVGGEIDVVLTVMDWGGHVRCAATSFLSDAGIDGAAVGVGRRALSPNGDGVFDEVAATYASDEPVSLDLAVFAAAADECAIAGPAVRTLESALTLDGSGAAEWDGKGDGGSALPEGRYAVVGSFRDGCGNVVEKRACLTLDVTRPHVELSTPNDGATVPTTVEVTGLVTDAELDSFAVEVGVGSVPTTWVPLPARRDQSGAVSATWNHHGIAGPYTVRIAALDGGGNRGEARAQVTVPAVARLIRALEASPPLLSPNDDGRLDAVQVTVDLAAAGVVDLALANAGGVVRSLASGVSLPAGQHHFSWDGRSSSGTVAADGTYALRLRARAASGPTTVEQEQLTLWVDATPPQLALSSPSGPFATAGDPLIGTIVDPHLVRYMVSLEAAGGTSVLVGQGTAGGSNLLLGRLGDLAEGSYELEIEAVDEGENRAALTVPLIVDRTAPVVVLMQPFDGSLWGAGVATIDVRGAVTETHLASWLLEVGAGDSPASWTTLGGGGELPGGQVSVAWATTALADGTYTLRLSAQDRAGLRGQALVKVKLDRTAPLAAITAPTNGGFVIGPLSIRGTAKDANLWSYALAFAPGAAATASQWTPIGGGTQSVDAGPLADWRTLPADGPYTLRLEVEDSAGNRSTALVEVTVDQRPPAKPVGLQATLEAPTDARLTWQANDEVDLAGYHVYRDGVRVTTTPLTTTSYLDRGLAEGRHVYQVTAVDRAGAQSEKSVEAAVVVDRTPPQTRFVRPLPGERVSGLFPIVGSAFSVDDFEQYRLFATPAGGTRRLLRSSSTAVRDAALADWPTYELSEGVAVTLLLEAEDLLGNVGSSEVSVVVDNLPPAAPAGLGATVAGANVELLWTANGEPDLLGYLLYRDGRLLHANGATGDDLRPVALHATRFTDVAAPDGTLRYVVYAIDQAGNLSAPSQPAQATLDNRAPHATFVHPADGSEFEAAQYVLATVPDSDVAEVAFAFRAAGETAWRSLAVDVTAPFEATFDPAGAQPPLPFASYQLQAVAKDFAQRVDPAPPVLTLVYTDLTRPPVPTGANVAVDGGDVRLAWTAVDDGDLAGYHLYRKTTSGNEVRLTAAPLAATSYLDGGVADGAYEYRVSAIDGHGNESDPTAPLSARVHTPALQQPYTPTRAAEVTIAGSSAVAGTAEAQATGGAASSSAAGTTTADGSFSVPLALPLGQNTIQARVTDALGNRSKWASLVVVRGQAPAAPQGLAATVAGHDVTLSWTPNAEPNVIGYRLFRDGVPLWADENVAGLTATDNSAAHGVPSAAVDGRTDTAWTLNTLAVDGIALEVSWPAPQVVAALRLSWFRDASGTYEAANYDLDAWDGRAWIRVAERRGNQAVDDLLALVEPYRTQRLRLTLLGQTTHVVRLAEATPQQRKSTAGATYVDTVADGLHTYAVSAVDDLAFESPRSPSIEVPVGDAVAPPPVELTASVGGSTVSLQWTASTAADLARYDLYRDGGKFAEHVELANRTRADVRPNGTYRYTVRAVDQVGNASVSSNEVEVTVAATPPGAPVLVAVTPTPSGGALDVGWQPAAGESPSRYHLLRALVAGGPYQPVTATTALQFHDAGLANGTRYFYVVRAEDAAGNLSAPSNERSGVPGDSEAPPSPKLDFPARPGSPFTTQSTPTTVAGNADPGTQVTILRDGRQLGVAIASSQLVNSILNLSVFGFETRVSPTGRLVSRLSSGNSHTLFDLQTGTSVNLASTSRSARFVGDGAAMVVNTTTAVRLYDAASGTLRDLVTTTLVTQSLLSSDGRTLLVLGQHLDQGFVRSGFWVVDLRTMTWRLPLFMFYDNAVPTSVQWSPDGRYVAFKQRNVGTALAVLDLQTGQQRLITTNASVGWWSPDSRRLLYGQAGIFSYDVTTAASTQLTTSGSLPQWSADGQSFVYVAQGAIRLRTLAGQESTLWTATPTALHWSGSGYLAYEVTGFLQRLLPAGRFIVPDVALQPGDNQLVAVARDAAGNASAPSQPVVVTLPAENLPDLVVAAAEIDSVPAAPLVGQTVRIGYLVRNLAAVGSTPSEVRLQVRTAAGTALVDESLALPALAPQGSRSFVRELPVAVAGGYTIEVTADPYARLTEASESNNDATRGFYVSAEARPQLTVTLDRGSYDSDDEVNVTAAVFNSGESVAGTLRWAVEDADGYTVADLGDAPTGEIAYGGTFTRATAWSTGRTFAGPYRVRALLVDAAGVVRAEGSASFLIRGVAHLVARIETDRATYRTGATVQIAGDVEVSSTNQILAGGEAKFVIRDAAGQQVFAARQELGTLLPDTHAALAASWPSGSAGAGSYDLGVEVWADGQLRASAASRFDLVAVELDVEGTLELSTRSLVHGDPLVARYSVVNHGVGARAGVPLRVLLADVARGELLQVEETSIDIAAGGTVSGEVTFASGELELRSYVVQLQVALDGTLANLDLASFTVTDGTPPTVRIVEPTSGAVVGGSGRIRLSALDSAGAVTGAQVAVDGAWQDAALEDAVESLFGIALAGAGEGDHVARASATDRAGNRGESAEVAFVVDRTAPLIVVGGLSDGGTYTSGVVPTVSVLELHPASQSVSLDGQPFVSGTTVDQPGPHVLVAGAEDLAGNRAEVTVRFTIDGSQPSSRLSIADASVVEGDIGTTDAVFAVHLTPAAAVPVSVSYATVGGTAASGVDFVSTSGELTFAIGQTEGSLVVPVAGDVVLEPEESFTVELSQPTGATVQRAVAVGTITDNEVCPGPNLVRNGGAEERPVGGHLPGWTEIAGHWLPASSPPPTAEGYSTFWSGTAPLGELRQDVDLSAFANRIDAGQQVFAFAAQLRSQSESPPDVARVVLELRDGANLVPLEIFDSGDVASTAAWQQVLDVRVAPPGTRWARVRLLTTRVTGGGNDAFFDAVSLRPLATAAVSVDDVTLYEGHTGTRNASFTVSLACAVPWSVALTYATTDETAVSGQDYSAANGSFVFDPGATSSKVDVPILADAVAEPSESFRLELAVQAPSEAVLADPIGRGTILDDDACQRSPGYWKNHQELWPLGELQLGGVWYYPSGIAGLLSYGGPDASSRLAHHLAAAKLNLASGSDPLWGANGSSILDTVRDADAFLFAHPPGSNPPEPARSEANALKNILDTYNNFCH